ncbi:hypothetical protein RJ639_012131 [Escallonia herrerae]|uniref:tRNA-splicing endonuclease subunit Sen54 N-terminal domain-containing protein n=1 Tax=Escallonia herrerae TaxID=1293975 RepID=A0AA89AP88_9ASTE|nr:hypothetical protein RJ639_012131 [Escallonia herrerae]
MDLVDGVGESSLTPRSFRSFSGYDVKSDVYNRLVESENEAFCNPEFCEQLDIHFNCLPASYCLYVVTKILDFHLSGWYDVWPVITCVMEVEDWASSTGGTSDSEISVQDSNDGEHCHISGDIPKLQYRSIKSKAHWNDELGLAEIVEKKGRMWTTTGIVRGGNICCSLEETLFLAQEGALQLSDDDNLCLSLEEIYKMVGQRKYGGCWESFQVYRHMKSLGYIVGRHVLPWTIKRVKSNPISLEGIPEANLMKNRGQEDAKSMIELLNSLRINNLRLVFDVYPPNSKFKKSSPGNPSYVLCLLSDHPPSNPEIEDLERQCDGLPLKFCHVDHGRVSYFSFDKVELPFLP